MVGMLHPKAYFPAPLAKIFFNVLNSFLWIPFCLCRLFHTFYIFIQSVLSIQIPVTQHWLLNSVMTDVDIYPAFTTHLM